MEQGVNHLITTEKRNTGDQKQRRPRYRRPIIATSVAALSLLAAGCGGAKSANEGSKSAKNQPTTTVPHKTTPSTTPKPTTTTTPESTTTTISGSPSTSTGSGEKLINTNICGISGLVSAAANFLGYSASSMVCYPKNSNGFYVSETRIADQANPQSNSYYVDVAIQQDKNGLFAGYEQQAHSSTGNNPSGAEAVASVDGKQTIWVPLTDTVVTKVGSDIVNVTVADSDRSAGTQPFQQIGTQIDSMVISNAFGA